MSKTPEELEAENAHLRDLIAAVAETAARDFKDSGTDYDTFLVEQRVAAIAVADECRAALQHPATLPEAARDLRRRVAAITGPDPGGSKPPLRTIDLGDGQTVVFNDGDVEGAVVAELHAPDGSITARGYGKTQAAAHQHLNQRLGELLDGSPS